MKQSFLLLFVITLFISCKKSEDPSSSNSNNSTTNTPPTLQLNLSYNVITTTAFQIDLSSKITDANGDMWSITNTSALHGTTSISNKVIFYTSNSGYVGNDTITVTMQDSKGASTTGKIAIVVSASSPTNHAPTFTSTSTTLYYNLFTNVLNNIFSLSVLDNDGDAVHIVGIGGSSLISSNSNVTATHNGGLQITITPHNSIYAGTTNLTISITDNKDTITTIITVNIGSSSQIDTYNILSNYFGSQILSHIGYVTFNAGSITTTGDEADFFNTPTNAGTYPFIITSNGMIAFTVVSIESVFSIQTSTPYLILQSETSGVQYVFGL